MSEPLTVTTERVDDIPLLWTHMEKMGLAELLDTHFPTHGNWAGLSLGQVATLWLTYILSQADHRLNHVQAWAAARLHTLQTCTHSALRSLDLADDRLAAVLAALSQDAAWADLEAVLTQRLLRVYDLRPTRVRLDSTTASGYWHIDPAGLFQLGHSKDHRPDLPQLKVMLATLDPLGLPLATAVVAGQRADDPLYLPVIQCVQQSLGLRGLLYIGDCKMAALETRARVAQAGDYYLCPLSSVQVPAAQLQALVHAVEGAPLPLTPVCRPQADGTLALVAEGYEQPVRQQLDLDGHLITWVERQVVVHSWKVASAAEAALHRRVATAQEALQALPARRRGKARLTSVAELEAAATAILSKQQVGGLLQVECSETVDQRPRRAYRGRPAEVQTERVLAIHVRVDEAALRRVVQGLGWRVYVTNAPASELPLEGAVLAYREEYLVERNFGRLKGQSLSLCPMYLAKEAHATGLVRLLSLGLRVLSLLEFEVRRRLETEGTVVRGLYAGNPQRATARPTAESILGGFQEINVNCVTQAGSGQWYLTPLTEVQQRLLALLDFPLRIYERLAEHSANPP